MRHILAFLKEAEKTRFSFTIFSMNNALTEKTKYTTTKSTKNKDDGSLHFLHRQPESGLILHRSCVICVIYDGGRPPESGHVTKSRLLIGQHGNGSSTFVFQVMGILKPVTVSTDTGLQLSHSPMVGCHSLYGSNFDFRMTYLASRHPRQRVGVPSHSAEVPSPEAGRGTISWGWPIRSRDLVTWPVSGGLWKKWRLPSSLFFRALRRGVLCFSVEAFFMEKIVKQNWLFWQRICRFFLFFQKIENRPNRSYGNQNLTHKVSDNLPLVSEKVVALCL